MEHLVRHRTRRHRLQLILQWNAGVPSTRELLALRKLSPEYGEMPPARLRALASDGGRMVLGTFAQNVAQQVMSLAVQLGLPMQAEDASFTSHVPVATTSEGQYALLIEDDDEAERIAGEMIAAGHKVEDDEQC